MSQQPKCDFCDGPGSEGWAGHFVCAGCKANIQAVLRLAARGGLKDLAELLETVRASFR